MEMLSSRGTLWSILQCLAPGVMESLRVPFALRLLARFHPPARQILMELQAIKLLVAFSTPGHIELAWARYGKDIPIHESAALDTPFPGLYRRRRQLSPQMKRRRISYLAFLARESAADILLSLIKDNRNGAEILAQEPAYLLAAFIHLQTPLLLPFKEELSLSISHWMILAQLASFPSAFQHNEEKLQIISILMVGLCSPSVAIVFEALTVTKFIIIQNMKTLRGIFSLEQLSDQLIALCYSPLARIANLAFECVDHLSKQKKWDNYLASIKDIILTPYLCFTLIHHRDKSGKRIGEGLWQLYLRMDRTAVLPTDESNYSNTHGHSHGHGLKESPQSRMNAFRLQGNVLYKDKRLEEAACMYASAIQLALLHNDRESLCSLLGNRAQCHLSLGEMRPCFRDASLALSFGGLGVLDGKDPKQMAIRAKNLARQASASRSSFSSVVAANALAFACQLLKEPGSLRDQWTVTLFEVEREFLGKERMNLICTTCRAPCRGLSVCKVCHSVAYCSRACELKGRDFHTLMAMNCAQISPEEHVGEPFFEYDFLPLEDGADSDREGCGGKIRPGQEARLLTDPFEELLKSTNFLLECDCDDE